MVRRQSGEGTKLLHIVGVSCLNSFQARQVFCVRCQCMPALISYSLKGLEKVKGLEKAT